MSGLSQKVLGMRYNNLQPSRQMSENQGKPQFCIQDVTGMAGALEGLD